MAVRSAIGGQFGFVNESTYGTFVAPTKFPPVQTANIKDESTYVSANGIAAGRLLPVVTRSVQAGEGGSANVVMPVWSKTFGLLLQALMGTSVTPVIIGAGPGYTQTHTLADPYGKSLTIQNGLPQMSDGVAKPMTLLGAKVIDAEFSCERDAVVMSTWNFAGREFTQGQTLATAAEVTSVPFSWINCDVKIGANIGAAAHAEGVKKWSVKVNRASNIERDYAGNLGKISEPVINTMDTSVITGSLDVDLVTIADFYDRWHNHTAFALDIVCTAGTFTGGTETFEIKLPSCYFTGETPNLDGTDVITGTLPFEVHYDLSTLPSIVYISQEAAL